MRIEIFEQLINVGAGKQLRFQKPTNAKPETVIYKFLTNTRPWNLIILLLFTASLYGQRHPFKATIPVTLDNGLKRDSLLDVILDPTFHGTDQELVDKINAGELEKYLVVDNDNKLYERIRVPVVVDNETFIEKNFMLLFGLLIVFGFGLYKYLGIKDKKNEGVGDEGN